MLTDPLFYLCSVPAVMMYGIAKGGFGGPVSVLAVPLMALIMSPTLAAAILLPILVVMDALVVKTYWGIYDRTALRIMLPGALLGVGLGYASAEYLNDSLMRLMIGVISLLFGLQSFFNLARQAQSAHNRWSGGAFGLLAGFTSFSIHAGGPPFSMYLMPRGLTPLVYAGTGGLFFATVNLVKLFPYYALGQLPLQNLTLSLVLMPLAPLGVAVGHRLVKRSNAGFYYRVISVFLVLLGVILVWRGLRGL
ncbi:MAG: sulfite exporter TauE/SafE family protein [Halieaceae bacterium]|jgi:uncharacterized membrane protein YfcA|nr:sulfite exporter TauE/SafE family protein [Halieaceae bacterium]